MPISCYIKVPRAWSHLRPPSRLDDIQNTIRSCQVASAIVKIGQAGRPLTQVNSNVLKKSNFPLDTRRGVKKEKKKWYRNICRISFLRIRERDDDVNAYTVVEDRRRPRKKLVFLLSLERGRILLVVFWIWEGIRNIAMLCTTYSFFFEKERRNAY